MPVVETTTVHITCGNPDCPGNDLPTDDRTGWMFVTAEVYGQAVPPQRVVCSYGCLAAFAQKVADGEEEWLPPEMNPLGPGRMPPPEPLPDVPPGTPSGEPPRKEETT